MKLDELRSLFENYLNLLASTASNSADENNLRYTFSNYTDYIRIKSNQLSKYDLEYLVNCVSLCFEQTSQPIPKCKSDLSPDEALRIIRLLYFLLVSICKEQYSSLVMYTEKNSYNLLDLTTEISKYSTTGISPKMSSNCLVVKHIIRTLASKYQTDLQVWNLPSVIIYYIIKYNAFTLFSKKCDPLDVKVRLWLMISKLNGRDYFKKCNWNNCDPKLAVNYIDWLNLGMADTKDLREYYINFEIEFYTNLVRLEQAGFSKKDILSVYKKHGMLAYNILLKSKEYGTSIEFTSKQYTAYNRQPKKFEFILKNKRYFVGEDEKCVNINLIDDYPTYLDNKYPNLDVRARINCYKKLIPICDSRKNLELIYAFIEAEQLSGLDLTHLISLRSTSTVNQDIFMSMRRTLLILLACGEDVSPYFYLGLGYYEIADTLRTLLSTIEVPQKVKDSLMYLISENEPFQ